MNSTIAKNTFTFMDETTFMVVVGDSYRGIVSSIFYFINTNPFSEVLDDKLPKPLVGRFVDLRLSFLNPCVFALEELSQTLE